MKKCTSVLLCVILVLSLCSVTATADQNAYMEAAADVKADSGAVTVTITAVQAVANARISVAYDPDYLTFNGVAAPNAVMSVKEEPGLVTIGLAWATAEAIQAGESLLKVGFVPTGGWDETVLTVTAEHWNGTAALESVQLPIAGTGYRFNDVTADKWYYEAVEFMADEGYIKGVTESTFGPGLEMSRAMFVTMLGRLDGAEVSKTETRFADVEADSYYSGYVAWADENGIVKGVGGDLFAPDLAVTREQMATFLYRYAKSEGMDLAVAESDAVLEGYTDSGEISNFAREAMIWAVDRGIINGVSAETLAPRASTTRAQAVVMLYRFFFGNGQ